MRILFIGNFVPPYEEENLHNITLLSKFSQEGHQCKVINISDASPKHSSNSLETQAIIFTKNYIDFILKLILCSFRSNIIHFSTKGYTRPGLMKLVTTAFIGKLMFKKIIITIHPEMFSIFGQLRSKMGGQQLLHLSFSMANKIICGDSHTLDIASLHYSNKDKFQIIPSFFQLPEETETIKLMFSKLNNKNKIIFISGIKYPSLLFDVLNELLSKFSDSNIGFLVSIAEQHAKQLQNIFQEIDDTVSDRIAFIQPNNLRSISLAYAKADLIIRTLSCDCLSLFHNIALTIKKATRAGKYIYCHSSLILIKEGQTINDIVFLIHKLLLENAGMLSTEEEDYYQKIKEMYSG